MNRVDRSRVMTRPEPSLPPYLHPALGASRPSAPEADSFRRPPAPSRGSSSRANGAAGATSPGAPGAGGWGPRGEAEPSLGGLDSGSSHGPCGNSLARDPAGQGACQAPPASILPSVIPVIRETLGRRWWQRLLTMGTPSTFPPLAHKRACRLPVPLGLSLD